MSRQATGSLLSILRRSNKKQIDSASPSTPAEAIMIQAKALFDTAVIARDEYLEGTYNELRKTIENEIFVAEGEPQEGTAFV